MIERQFIVFYRGTRKYDGTGEEKWIRESIDSEREAIITLIAYNLINKRAREKGERDKYEAQAYCITMDDTAIVDRSNYQGPIQLERLSISWEEAFEYKEEIEKKVLAIRL